MSEIGLMYTYRMIIKEISLMNFRGYKKKTFRFDDEVNVIYGGNGAGKTNLMEAVNLLSVGQSFKAGRTEEMIRFGEDLARIEVKLFDGDDEVSLGVVLTGGEVNGKRIAKKKFFLEEVSKRKRDFVGVVTAVIFRPEDLELMDGTPAMRRRFLDLSLIKVFSEYERHLSTYDQALRRRNKLLDAIRDGLATRYALTFWDGLLIKHGKEIERIRSEYLEFINNLWLKSELFNGLEVVYDKSVVSESRLRQYKDEEVAVGYTLVGPHKDDFVVKDRNGKELSIYGSRGEQRMAVLALKMGELYYIEAVKKIKPILLLDDIFSELDEKHRNEVLRVTFGRQVLVTTADDSELMKFKKAKVIKLS